jgi:polyferredoxin
MEMRPEPRPQAGARALVFDSNYRLGWAATLASRAWGPGCWLVFIQGQVFWGWVCWLSVFWSRKLQRSALGVELSRPLATEL